MLAIFWGSSGNMWSEGLDAGELAGDGNRDGKRERGGMTFCSRLFVRRVVGNGVVD